MSSITENVIYEHKQSAMENSTKRADELNKLYMKSQVEHIDPSPLPNHEGANIENEIVEELNKTLAIVHTTSTYILVEKTETEFVLDSKSSILTLYENQVVPELAVIKSQKIPSKAQVWLKSPNRRTYENIVFNPKINGHYETNYNIFKGFSIKSIKGDCSLFWKHVELTICNGVISHYIYVRKWLAHLIQKPWIISTALVLRGKQGTGKGIFVNSIGVLVNPHYAPLANLDQILGRFNSHLKNSLLIFADEAIWGGNKKQVGLLKALITEPKLFIEAKGKDGYFIDNFKHLIVSSNENWAVHLDPDDRRFFVLDVSSERKEDFKYFEAITTQLQNGGYEALMFDLLHEDLSNFDPKSMPENFTGFDMKLESASSIDRFVYISLKEECWDHAYAGPSNSLEDLTIQKFNENYKTWCEGERLPVENEAVVGKRLRELIPDLESKRTPREIDIKRRSKYCFPSLEVCRLGFEKAYKQNEQIWELS